MPALSPLSAPSSPAIARVASGPACHGGVHLRLLPAPGEQLSPLRLATLIGEQESEGHDVRVVTLAVRQRSHASQAWLPDALTWLRDHGRAVVVRTRVVLRQDVLRTARRGGVTFALELAHTDPAIDAALLGSESAPVSGRASLLLQAQHMRALGLPVVARLGPLLPGIHDTRQFSNLLSTVAAADLDRIQLATGAVDGARLQTLRQHLDAGAQVDLANALSVPPFAPFNVDQSYRPADWIETAERETFASMVREAGMDHEQCGCVSACESPGAYVPVLSPELFAS